MIGLLIGKLRIYVAMFAAMIMAAFGIYVSGRKSALSDVRAKQNERRVQAMHERMAVENSLGVESDEELLEKAKKWKKK